MPPRKNKYTLIAGDKKTELTDFQSPRGVRNGVLRPDIVIIDCYIEADYLALAKHIQYLTELLTSLQVKKNDQNNTRTG